MTGVDHFIKLFSGRQDCHGLNQMCLKEPLTKEIYQHHINGVKRIGVYPIYNNIWTKWLACDIDTDDFNLALDIKNRAAHFNVYMHIERSKSKGYHVWTFFDKPIEAVKPRLVFEMIMEELDTTCEIFPKQDEVGENQFGNFIFLPLFGGDIKRGRTVFVDDTNNIFVDNLPDLKKIKITEVKNIEETIVNNELERKTIILKETPVSEHRTFSRELPCIEKIKQGVDKGNRDIACLRLVINYKEKGIPREDIETLISNWNLKNKQHLPSKDLIKTINSVFRGNYKSYGCEDPIIQQYCDKEKCPLTESQLRKEQIEEGVITMVFRDADTMVFRKKNYEYRLAGFEFTKAGKFKVSLTLSKDSKIVYKDLVKLDMASNRKRFINAANDDELDSDLITIDDLVKKQLEKEEQDKLLTPKQLYIMTEQEKDEAVKFLENTPDILYRVIDITNKMGVVGDEVVRLMVYLCYTSRIMKDPLSITVKGESSSGKSFSCQNIQRLIPEEGYHFITRATQNAFYHLPEDGMQHRIIYINELPGSESADYSIRTAQSEGDLILMMPIKDPNTGAMETVTKKVKGPVGFLITTTKAQMFDENETRNFSVFSDDSPQLTTAIGDITIRKAQGEEFIIEEQHLNLWKNVQRLLNPDFKVIIPYAKEVFSSFPDKPVRIRRDRERFRVLIEIITMLHQFHRKQEKAKGDKIHLISTLADYYIAKIAAEAILTYTIYEIGPAAEELWKAIKLLNDSYVPDDDHKSMEYTFKYRDLAEDMDWKVDKIKKWAYVLVKAGLLDYAEKGIGGKGKASVFKISKRGLEWSSDSLGFLPSVESLYDKYPCSTEIFYNPISGVAINPLQADAPEGLLE